MTSGSCRKIARSPLGEIQPDLVVHLNLRRARELILDRVFNRDHVFPHAVEAGEDGVERGALSRPGGSGGEDHPVRPLHQLFHGHQVIGGEAQFAQLHARRGFRQEAEHQLLAGDGGDDGGADVEDAAAQAGVEAAVLRQAAFPDVHAGHDLDAGGDGQMQVHRIGLLIEEHAVHAEPHLQPVDAGLDVDVAGAGHDRGLDQFVHQGHRGRIFTEPGEARVLIGLHHQPRLDQRVGRFQFVLFAVEAVDAAVNHAQVGPRGPDVSARKATQFVQLEDVVGLDHRHHELVAHQLDGKHLQAHGFPARNQFERAVIHVEVKFRDHRHWLGHLWHPHIRFGLRVLPDFRLLIRRPRQSSWLGPHRLDAPPPPFVAGKGAGLGCGRSRG